jgi:predicted RNase H-like HicB family nuclease
LSAAQREVPLVNFQIEFEQEEDGRWIADIPSLPGVMAYGASRQEAESKVQAIALRVIADTLEREHTTTDQVKFAAA